MKGDFFMSERKKNNIGNKNSKEYLKLQLVGFIIYLIFFIIASAVSVMADIKIDYMTYISMLFIGLSSLFTGFISGIKERKNGIIRGVLGALPINSSVIIISLIFSHFKADLSLLYTAVVCLVMSAVGGIISVNIRLK